MLLDDEVAAVDEPLAGHKGCARLVSIQNPVIQKKLLQSPRLEPYALGGFGNCLRLGCCHKFLDEFNGRLLDRNLKLGRL